MRRVRLEKLCATKNCQPRAAAAIRPTSCASRSGSAARAASVSVGLNIGVLSSTSSAGCDAPVASSGRRRLRGRSRSAGIAHCTGAALAVTGIRCAAARLGQRLTFP